MMLGGRPRTICDSVFKEALSGSLKKNVRSFGCIAYPLLKRDEYRLSLHIPPKICYGRPHRYQKGCTKYMDDYRPDLFISGRHGLSDITHFLVVISPKTRSTAFVKQNKNGIEPSPAEHG